MRLAPWQVKGIGPQARETAREAARRSGMSVGQWLNSVILDQGAEDAIDDDAYDDAAERGDDLASITARLDDLGRQVERLAGKPASPAERDSAPSQRIAEAIQTLNGRLDRLIAEERSMSSALERRVNSVDQALAKLSRERVRAAASYSGGEPVSVSIEQATAEIAARQRALDDEFAAPAPDILRQPALAPFQCRADAAVDSLRKDLAEIGRVLSEAMPREAVEALEGEVRALGTRLDAAHTSDAPAVAGLEQGLHEVRDALRGLAPAESLIGFDEAIKTLSRKIDVIAVPRENPAALQQLEASIASLRGLVGQVASADALASLAQEVRSLAERVERGVSAPAGADVLASLDRRIASIADAIETVRAQPARESSPQLDRLVDSLGEKLDRLQAAASALPSRGEPVALGGLEDRIAKLSEKLDALRDARESSPQIDHLTNVLSEKLDRLQAAASALPSRGDPVALGGLEDRIARLSEKLDGLQGARESSPQIDQLVNALSEKLDRLQAAPSAPLSRGEQIVLGGLEDRIAKLSEKLDASEGRLGHLEAIERGMAELLTHLEAMRTAPPAPVPAPIPNRGEAPEPLGPPVATLGHDIAALRQAQSAGERRTRDSLEDVQGTIETVVDRLATIETTIRHDPRGTPLPPGPGPEPAPEPSLSPLSMPEPAAPAPPAPPANPPRSARPPSGPRPPIDPSLPADHPLEPGSGPPRPRPAASAALVATPGPAASSAADPAAGAVTAAERVAASEAPLRATNGAAGEAEPKANYLQAARRAAQMAQATRRPQAAAAAPEKAGSSKLPQQLKTLLVGLSVAVLIVVALRFLVTFFFPQFAELTPAPALAERQVPDQVPDQAPDQAPEQASDQASDQAPVRVIIARPGTAPSGDAPPMVIVPPIAQPAAPMIVSPLSPAAAPAASIAPPAASANPLFAPYVPATSAAAPRADQPAPAAAPSTPPTGDVTGSIAAAPPAPTVAPAADRLPPGIGGAALIAAANKGEPAAAYEVATRFAEGRGVPQSFQQAAIWYERAAKGGLAPALFRLGALYEKGDGVTRDLNEARRLYLAAADKGNVNAMHNIGVLYAEGIDGKPDFKSAAQWFRKSAMYGVGDSQYNLAVLYARGIGLERNFAEAFRWFSLAAKSGDTDAAKKRDEIAAHLDAKSLAVARQAVDGFAAEQASEEATTVKPPPGGWDQAQPAKRGKPASSARARPKAQAI